MIIRIANESDLKRIAVIHRTCFRGTFIAYWGKNLITKYYEEFFKELPLFVVAEENSKMAGFCMGYQTGSQARQKFLQHNKVRLAFRLGWLCLTLNGLVIKKCWNAIKPNSKDNIKNKDEIFHADADLLSICIVDVAKGTGISQQLVEAFEGVLTNYGFRDYTLSVYKTNARAITFYKKMGLYIVSENDDEYKMYKKIERV